MKQMPGVGSTEDPRQILRMTLNPEQEPGLKRKLEEYRARLKKDRAGLEFLALEVRGEMVASVLASEYKIAILEALLSGNVERERVWEKIEQKDGKVNRNEFDNAWGVIHSYNSGNLRSLRDGTPFTNK